jgi:hypothetical protein
MDIPKRDKLELTLLVDLFQIKDEYYVSDDNHRISAAKELGHDEILARIVEFMNRNFLVFIEF